MSKRREQTYLREAEKYGGYVPCFCCGKHVGKRRATLEHILPRALGGKNNHENLAISHKRCNVERGHKPTDRAEPCDGIGAQRQT